MPVTPAMTDTTVETTIAPAPGMTRWKAAAIHLGISAAVTGLVLFAMLTLWYPPPLFLAEGGGDLLAILIPVDIVLGPLITLVIFKTGKPGLRRDLGIVAFLQAAALIYGCYVMMQTRPVFIAFSIDQFLVVRASDLDDADIEQAQQTGYGSLSLTGPKTVAVVLPTDKAELGKLLANSLQSGKGLHRMPRLFAPYEAHATEALQRSRPVYLLRKHDMALANKIEGLIQQYGLKSADLSYLPFQTRGGDGLALIDGKTGKLVKLVPSLR